MFGAGFVAGGVEGFTENTLEGDGALGDDAIFETGDNLAEQKAARDARYAARKQKQKKGR